jgi:hypothetical protein
MNRKLNVQHCLAIHDKTNERQDHSGRIWAEDVINLFARHDKRLSYLRGLKDSGMRMNESMKLANWAVYG